MEEIKTLVYFDLEATGLKNSGRPRITELSFVAVKKQDILVFNLKIRNLLNKIQIESTKFKLESLLPRIVNKLTLCVYPMATIVPSVSDITGLDNYMLSDYSTFDKGTGNLINSFLAHLPSPVCLIAHNGDLYDYPILKAEMQKADTPLDPTILCADSYVGLKDIYQQREDAKGSENALDLEVRKYEEKKNINEELKVVNALIIAGEFETTIEINEYQQFNLKTKNHNQDSKSVNSPIKPSSLQHSKAENLQEIQFTPKRTNEDAKINKSPQKIKRSSGYEPLNVRKKLNFSITSKPKSFSLVNLHTHLLGFPPSKSHGAEADCISLLRTTAMLCQDWLDWVEKNCRLLEDCRPMWGIAGKQ